MEENQKKSIRVSCRLEVESKTFGQKWFIIYSENISTDGMMLTSEASIEKIKKLGIDIGKNIFLSFYLPNDENYVTKISGKVVYVKKKPDSVDGNESSFIGIKFNEVSGNVNKHLKIFISAMESKVIISRGDKNG